mgnify:CR=1 FL=1
MTWIAFIDADDTFTKHILKRHGSFEYHLRKIPELKDRTQGSQRNDLGVC